MRHVKPSPMLVIGEIIMAMDLPHQPSNIEVRGHAWAFGAFSSCSIGSRAGSGVSSVAFSIVFREDTNG